MHCLWEIIDNGVDEALAGACRRDRGHAAPRRLGRGARRRSRHPGRQGAQDRSAGRRGGLHQAARRRQVRRLARTSPPAVCTASARRWSTRCRPGSTSTSTATPSQQGMSLPARRAGRLRRRRPGRDVPREQSGLTRKGGRVAKAMTGTRIRFWPDRQIFTKDATFELRRAARARPADVVHRARARAGDPRPARRRPASRRSSVTTAASRSSPSSWRTTSRSPTSCGCRARDHVHRDRAGARRAGPHDAAGGRARARRRRRAAVGDGLRHRAALVRQRHRDPQGRHPRQRLRAGRSPRPSTT